MPLRTSQGLVVDARGDAVMLACVNWYGAHLEQMVSNGLNVRPLAEVARSITELGFNCVRLPYSLDLVLGNQSHVPDPDVSLAANPELKEKTPLEVFDVTIKALTDVGLMVILNNHISSAGWCCNSYDGEGLWYTTKYPEDVWMKATSFMAQRYANNSLVVGFDLRNEIRPSGEVIPSWGTGDPKTDWGRAAEKAAKRVVAKNDNMLIIVSGLYYSEFLCDVPKRPIHQSVPALHGRIVYTAHEYPWFNFHMVAREYIGLYFAALLIFAFSIWLCLAICPRLEGSWAAKGCCASVFFHRGRQAWDFLTCTAAEGETPCCGQFRRCWAASELLLAIILTMLSVILLVFEPQMVDRCSTASLAASLALLSVMVLLALVSLVLWMRIIIQGASQGWLFPKICKPGAQRREMGLPEMISTISLQPVSAALGKEEGSSRTQVESVTSPREVSVDSIQVTIADMEAQIVRQSSSAASSSSFVREVPQELEETRPPWVLLRTRRCLIGTVILVLVATLSYLFHDFGRYETFRSELDDRWGFLTDPHQNKYNVEAAPVWLGEFGTNDNDYWWGYIIRYLKERPVGWAYWPLNGQKTNSESEPYGIYDEDMKTIRNDWKLSDVQGLIAAERAALLSLTPVKTRHSAS